MEKEYLQKLVNESKSLSEVLRKMNKAVSGTSVKMLKETLISLDICFNHLTNYPRKNKKYELNDILIENSIYQPSKLKRRLIECGLKKDVCEICGQTNEWNGKHLTLQLDHINGNHYDNRLENLRIVCPNCHTQTDTFGNKTKNKEEKLCPNCGRRISKTSTYCQKCAPLFKKKKHSNKPTKDELLKLIFTIPFTQLGKKYNVTDNCIRKWCRSYNIPSTKKEMSDYINDKEQKNQSY